MNIILLSNIYMSTDTAFFEGLHFTTEHLWEALGYMVKGMAGIFIVLIIIYLASVLLQKLFPVKKDDNNEKGGL